MRKPRADEIESVPRVHGNGFIQLDLTKDGTMRLHVWDKEVPRQTVATPIHDHVFDIRSEVFCGTLIHEEIAVLPAKVIGGTHRVFQAQREKGTQNTILVPTGDEVSAFFTQRLVLGAGSLYTFEAGRLHQTDHRGLTATIMRKIHAPGDYGQPRVLVPNGLEPDNVFRRDDHDPSFLWSIIDRVPIEEATSLNLGQP